MVRERLTEMIRYALAVASEADDPRDRELGPIHLLKYLYLGDMAFAEANDGQTYSGTRWTFHRYGPWSAEVHGALAETVRSIGGRERQVANPYRDEMWRWSYSARPESVSGGLPTSVVRAIGSAVKSFHNDTRSLLHHVYRTGPMLRAAPGEVLVFRPKERDTSSPDSAVAAPLPVISKTQIRNLRQRVRQHLAARRHAEATPTPAGLYDASYFEILDLLDREPGEPVEPSSGTLEFSDQVWRSDARRESELP